jgi:acetyl esterase
MVEDVGVMPAADGSSSSTTPRRLWWWSSVAAALTSVAVLLMASARPGALIIRRLLEHDNRVSRPADEQRTEGVVEITDVPYDIGDADALLDVYFPSSVAALERRPLVVWMHGGAWIAGTKAAAAPYFRLLARGGFTVISVEYSRAPDARYPTPIRQINAAIAYALGHADRFHVDVEHVIVAGDSAGAQMASQIAAMVTNPEYAADVGITPSLRPEQLRGAILFCGAYDASGVARHPRAMTNTALRLFTRTVLWAYTGSRERDSAVLQQMSTIDHVTHDFPPTFISGGNADPLTDAHSRPFAARLADLGVDVTARFYAPDRTPALGHECQFRVETADGWATLQAVLGFARRHTDTDS